MDNTVRKSAVAGRFYPGNPSSLIDLMDQLLLFEKEKIDYKLTSNEILGGIVPHAGMVYSGYQAVHFFELVKQSNQTFDTIVIVNPNHSVRCDGLFNISNYGYWETPLGKIETDPEFSNALGIEINNQAHDFEHSGEVQLPFIQHFFKFQYKLVMITMNVQHCESATLLADKLVHAVKQTGRKILLIASSDFNHYESQLTGFYKDQYVIDRILEFDDVGTYNEVKNHHVSACGYGPIMTLLTYTKLIEKKPSITILKRGHSGEVYPSEEVVDYVSFLVTRSDIA
jgi:AmmeMemoRadiSam system protein B